jgi:hypothetical protein
MPPKEFGNKTRALATPIFALSRSVQKIFACRNRAGMSYPLLLLIGRGSSFSTGGTHAFFSLLVSTDISCSRSFLLPCTRSPILPNNALLTQSSLRHNNTKPERLRQPFPTTADTRAITQIRRRVEVPAFNEGQRRYNVHATATVGKRRRAAWKAFSIAVRFCCPILASCHRPISKILRPGRRQVSRTNTYKARHRCDQALDPPPLVLQHGGILFNKLIQNPLIDTDLDRKQ